MAVNNTTPPALSGTAKQGFFLQTTNGVWDFDLDYLTYAYRWLRCDSAGANCVAVGGATNSSYQLTAADVGSRMRSEVTATEHTYTDPDPLLTWEPPTLSNPVQWTMSNANRMSSSLLSGGGRDLLITSSEVLTGPVQQLNSWRHIVWIGGEINLTGAGDNYALPLSHTGTAHLEGLKIRCDGDAIMTRGGAAGAIVQIQNCFIEVHFNGGNAEHSDCFQTQGNTKIEELRMDKVTMKTDYQGMFLRLSPSSAFLNGGDLRRINFRNRGSDPAQAFFFLADEDTAAGHPPGPPIGTFDVNDAYMEATFSSPNSILYPSVLFESAFVGVGNFGNREGAFEETDGTGDYLRGSTTADVVPPGGSASGQQCEFAGWTGIFRLGVPPGGDWCPSTTPGVSYVSPGYL